MGFDKNKLKNILLALVIGVSLMAGGYVIASLVGLPCPCGGMK